MIKRITEYIKKHPLAILVGGIIYLLLTLNSVIAALIDLPKNLEKLTGPHITVDEKAFRDLAVLSTGVNISHYIDILGNFETKKRSKEGNLTEYVFLGPYRYFVQAIVDSDDNVVRYSITILQPTTKVVRGFADPLDKDMIIWFTLGKSTFSALDYLKIKPVIRFTENNMWQAYSEEYSYSDSQKFILSVKQGARDLPDNEIEIISPHFDNTLPLNLNKDDKQISVYRNIAVPNTLTYLDTQYVDSTNEIDQFELGVSDYIVSNLEY